MVQWLKCLFGFHDADPTHVVTDMGAVYFGSLCRKCLRPVHGKFLCNEWDESKCVTLPTGGEVLRGLNPMLRSGTYIHLCDRENLPELSRLARQKRKQNRPSLLARMRKGGIEHLRGL